jgi:hypothetical protein
MPVPGPRDPVVQLVSSPMSPDSRVRLYVRLAGLRHTRRGELSVL